jgi:hypothetical protein
LLDGWGCGGTSLPSLFLSTLLLWASLLRPSGLTIGFPISLFQPANPSRPPYDPRLPLLPRLLLHLPLLLFFPPPVFISHLASPIQLIISFQQQLPTPPNNLRPSRDPPSKPRPSCGQVFPPGLPRLCRWVCGEREDEPVEKLRGEKVGCEREVGADGDGHGGGELGGERGWGKVSRREF